MIEASAVRSAALVPPERLYRKADLSAVPFATTAELTPPPGMAAQDRAHDAIAFGTQMRHRGFNVFAIGSPGARLQPSVRVLLEEAAHERPRPRDWVYVNNFAAPQKAKALSLPNGLAPEFAKAVHDVIDDLKVALPAVFESEDYQKRRNAIEQSVRSKGEAGFGELQHKAEAQNIAILRTPMGFAMAPLRNGKVIAPDEFNAWPPEQQQAVRVAIEALEQELEEKLQAVPRMEKELRDAVRDLDRDTARVAMLHPFEELKARFSDLPPLIEHIDAIAADLLENIRFLVNPDIAVEARTGSATGAGGPFDRYEINVLVTAGDGGGAPVVEELHPTLGNLVGRIEYLQLQGALVTNFRLIKAGALHRANGGTLMLDARNLLSEPFAWQALKRALLRREIVIEDVAHVMGLTSTVSLEPDPIPLDVKIILFGDRMLYYMLAALDPDIGQFFKVLADFDDDVARTPAGEATLAHVIGDVATQEGLHPLDRDAVACAIEHASRLSEDAGKLTLLTDRLRDLLVEADHWAQRAGRTTVARVDVCAAIEQQIRRASRARERVRESMLRDIELIETSGSRVGQINGLSVATLGDFSFGQPSRITCRVRPGGGKIVDIEREVELGGPLHSKGILILGGFLAGRYVLDSPMSLQASLVFEQSYGGVEGDSASSAELYVLLSALAEVPLRQDLAVTGSVNQHGVIQAIGGVNDKIEGFFDLCDARGLTGTQGVLIPAANVQHLMLRADVVEACRAGRFGVYAVQTVDEGLAVLTGRDAGERDASGVYPEGSVNRLTEDRLRRFARIRPPFLDGSHPGGDAS